MSATGRIFGMLWVLLCTAAAFAAPAQGLPEAIRARSKHDADSVSNLGGDPTGLRNRTKYVYDERGNRLTKDVAGGTSSDSVYAYDTEDRLTGETRGITSIAYGYDGRGCLVSKADGSTLSTYDNDYLGRLTHFAQTVSGKDEVYTYAPTGDRVLKQDTVTPANNEWYLPSEGDTLCDFTKVGSTETFTGIYVSPGVDGRVARVGASGPSTANYYFADALQSSHQISNSSGVITGTNFTDAWGNDLAIGMAPPTGAEARYGFDGRERDNESGLQFFRARSYDPMVGRFTSRDPVAHSNLYYFVNNDPANKSDPNGRDVWQSDWDTLSYHLWQLRDLESKGDAEAYGRVYSDTLSWAHGVVDRQGWNEVSDRKEAEKLLGHVLERNTWIKGANESKAAQLTQMAGTQSEARANDDTHDTVMGVMEGTAEVTRDVGMVAGVAAFGAGGLMIAAEKGVEAGVAFYAAGYAAEKLSSSFANEVGESAREMGGSKEDVDMARRSTHAVFGLASGLVIARGFQGLDDVPESYDRPSYIDDLPEDYRAYLLEDQTCNYCGKRPATTLDHFKAVKADFDEHGYEDGIVERSARLNNPDNLVPSCKSCNSSKGARTFGEDWFPDIFDDGF